MVTKNKRKELKVDEELKKQLQKLNDKLQVIGYCVLAIAVFIVSKVLGLW